MILAAWAWANSTVKLPRCSGNRPRHTAATSLPGCNTARNRGAWPPRTSPACSPRSRVNNAAIAASSPCRRAASTKPVTVHCIRASYHRRRPSPLTPPRAGSGGDLRLVVEADGAEALGVVGPVFAHLDEQEQVDAAAA